jgi:hypothetical protein
LRDAWKRVAATDGRKRRMRNRRKNGRADIRQRSKNGSADEADYRAKFGHV